MADRGPIVLLLRDAETAGHAWLGHPERPERTEAAAAGVTDGAAAAGARLVVRTAPPAARGALEAVHDPAYLDSLTAVGEAGGGWLDADTYLVTGSPAAATRSAGLMLAASEAAAVGQAAVAFALTRPPGHHAHHGRGQGFCLVNHVAVAAAHLRARGAARRVAIVDWDVHHGDGTQAIVGDDPEVFYASSHQHPWYPGTGTATGGHDTVLNVPLEAGSGDRAFISAWVDVILPALTAFGPDAILVSAGYDAHAADPLAGLEVTADGFGQVATAVGASARVAGIDGVALALEGGYDISALRASVAATVEGLLRGLAGD